MQHLLSSRERLRNSLHIEDLIAFLAYHGARGYREVMPSYREFDEIEKFNFVPMIFGLLPASILKASDSLLAYKNPKKPRIKRHLENLDILPNEILVDILKCIADQYSITYTGVVNRRRKLGVSDLRALGKYQLIREMQGSRCGICGSKLESQMEELDHIVPWRLIGDIDDGANWRLLCGDCNKGKSSLLCTIQSNYAHNWVYSTEENEINTINLQTRWVTLVQRKKCYICGKGPMEASLIVIPISGDAPFVVDCLNVKCEFCAENQLI